MNWQWWKRHDRREPQREEQRDAPDLTAASSATRKRDIAGIGEAARDRATDVCSGPTRRAERRGRDRDGYERD